MRLINFFKAGAHWQYTDNFTKVRAMKNQKVTYLNNGNDTTQTLKILVGETFEDTIVTEKLSTARNADGELEHYAHFTLESPSTERQVYRTLEELALEEEELKYNESVDSKILLELTDDIKLVEEPDFEILDV